MTNRTEQGTGKHAHKDSQEPWPHQGKDGSESSERESGGRKDDQHSKRRGAQGRSEAEGRGEAQGSGGESLKEREYRDAQGNVHHHTKTYEEQHGKK